MVEGCGDSVWCGVVWCVDVFGVVWWWVLTGCDERV